MKWLPNYMENMAQWNNQMLNEHDIALSHGHSFLEHSMENGGICNPEILPVLSGAATEAIPPANCSDFGWVSNSES